MSIFPKRTVCGTQVTIHWNFNTAHLKDKSICPLVRIGVKAPDGKVTILIEKHLLALPAIQQAGQRNEGQALHLNKNTPLLIMADYLSGKHKREQLVDILQNIQSGRHYYFIYMIPADAPLGKYTLISEVLSGGTIRYSKTALDDYFFVEDVSVRLVKKNVQSYETRITNNSPEPTPVKIIDYIPDKEIHPEQVNAFELNPFEEKNIITKSLHAFLSYNEERVLLPLNTPKGEVYLRNPEYLELYKEQDNTLYLIHSITEEAFKLSPDQRMFWQKADGIHTKDEITGQVYLSAFDELLKLNLIKEISI